MDGYVQPDSRRIICRLPATGVTRDVVNYIMDLLDNFVSNENPIIN